MQMLNPRHPKYLKYKTDKPTNSDSIGRFLIVSLAAFAVAAGMPPGLGTLAFSIVMIVAAMIWLIAANIINEPLHAHRLTYWDEAIGFLITALGTKLMINPVAIESSLATIELLEPLRLVMKLY